MRKGCRAHIRRKVVVRDDAVMASTTLRDFSFSQKFSTFLCYLKVKEEGDRMLEELRELLEGEGDEGVGDEGELAAVPPSLFRQDSVGLYSCQVRLLSVYSSTYPIK
jgi:hypothetical protein